MSPTLKSYGCLELLVFFQAPKLCSGQIKLPVDPSHQRQWLAFRTSPPGAVVPAIRPGAAGLQVPLLSFPWEQWRPVSPTRYLCSNSQSFVNHGSFIPLSDARKSVSLSHLGRQRKVMKWTDLCSSTKKFMRK